MTLKTIFLSETSTRVKANLSAHFLLVIPAQAGMTHILCRRQSCPRLPTDGKQLVQ